MMNAVQGASWMSHCLPETLITKLLLPGTHDTMTASCPERHYHTQIMSLEEQLMAGVRFLDLRLRREMKRHIGSGSVILMQIRSFRPVRSSYPVTRERCCLCASRMPMRKRMITRRMVPH